MSSRHDMYVTNQVGATLIGKDDGLKSELKFRKDRLS